VNVIGHDAVGNNRKAFFAGSTVELLNHATDKVRFDE
jgi:hypothetical protein